MNTGDKNSYTGIDELDVMTNAENYNAFLVNLVLNRNTIAKNCVDFGAGRGTFAKMLQQRNLKVRCIEPDPTLATKLVEDGLENYSSIDEVHEIEYLYSLNVLEHIEDDRSVVKQIFEHMRCGGEIFFYVPAFMVLYTSLDKKVGHFRRYRKYQLVELFESVGFILDEIRYVDSLGFFVTLLFKWIGNSNGKINPKALKIYDKLVFPLSRVCDFILSPFFGKNVMIRAHKPKC